MASTKTKQNQKTDNAFTLKTFKIMNLLCLTKKNFSLKKILIVAFAFFMSVIKTLKIENVVVITDMKK